MKREGLVLLLAAALLCGPMAAADDSLESVLARYYEAIGGVDAWKSVKSCRMSGQMVMPMTEMEAPFTVTYAPPSKMRTEFSIQGMTGAQVFDGESAWAIVPFTGSLEPQTIPEEQAALMREQADFTGPLIDWQAKGHQVELIGKEKTDGAETYHLEVTLASGSVRHFFLDAEDYLPVRMEATTDFQGTEMEIETIFSDFRQVGELVMAHSIESRPTDAPEGQRLTIETIELDIELSDDLFTRPGDSGDEAGSEEQQADPQDGEDEG